MPFLYVYVCDLLEDLGCLVYRDCPMLVGLEKETNNRTVNWFKRHKNRLNEFSVDARAVMMFFHPEKHIDRDYGLDAERLEQLIARVLNLPRNLHTELQMWRNGPVYGDLAACVQRVMEKMAEMFATRSVTDKVTVEDIDQTLLKIASHNPNSSPEVRSLAAKVKTYDAIELLGKVYRSLGGKEAKWLTRLILKDYGPIKVPEHLDFSSSMQFLPTCVRVSAEIPIADAFPALREGTGIIKGTKSMGPSLLYRGYNTPQTASPKRMTAFATAKRSICPLSTPPMTAPYRPSSSILPISVRNAGARSQSREALTSSKKTRGYAAAKASVNQLSALPMTAPHPSSSTVTRTSVYNTTAHSQNREPLAPLDVNSQQSQHSSLPKADGPSSSMPSISIPEDTPFTTRVTDGASLLHPRTPRAIRNSTSLRYQAPSPETSLPMTINGTGTCILTPKLCPLTNCIFLLSPCISSIPYITDELLPWHGSRTVTSLHSFSDPSLPRRCPRTGKKYRKIALVESNRSGPTLEFMIRIERLNLRRSRGKKQWVEVYDWRILEYIMKKDRGEEKGYNPWRRCWMGAV